MACTKPSYKRSYDCNPNKLEHFAAKKLCTSKKTVLAYLDNNRSYDRNSVIVLATGAAAEWSKVLLQRVKIPLAWAT